MSNIKSYFRSRWGDCGRLVEADLSQIEIVVLAFLSCDKQLKQDVHDGVDFHCKRLSKKTGEDYDSVLAKYEGGCPPYAAGRRAAKSISFQRAYGAGVPKISESLGLPRQEVAEFIRAEDEMYPGVVAMHKDWIEEVGRNRHPTSQRSKRGFPVGRGWMLSCTGQRYVFVEEDAPEFLDRRGVHTSFRPTQIKNYGVQGFAGEILKLCIGSLYRLIKSDIVRASEMLLVNTIHDSVVLDVRLPRVQEAVEMVHGTFESAPSLIQSVYGLEFDLPIRTDVSVGVNWKSMEKV